MTYLFTRYDSLFFYNLEDDTYYRAFNGSISNVDTYSIWNKSRNEWTSTKKFKYIIPINERYYNGLRGTFSEMCDYYKDKLIFENI